jgi:hypothetical protein
MFKSGVLASAISILATPAWPCSVVGPLPTPTELVSRAEVIVRARAGRLSDEPGRQGSLAGSRTQVRFVILSVLKGALSSSAIVFNGHLEDRDDPNDRPVPYNFVRPGGRHGNCFALGYRQGAEYLLFLTRADHPAYAQPSDLTPYWTPLAPTNEQLFGETDPWQDWVVQQIAAAVRRGIQ